MVNEISSVKSTLLRILNFLHFNHVCNITISNNEKSNLHCKYTNRKKLRDLTPGHEVNQIRFSHGTNKVIFNFSSYVLTEDKKVYVVKGLGFLYHLKRLSILTFLRNMNCYVETL